VSGIQADFTGAFAKTMALKNIPKATRYQLTVFSDETVKALKESARSMVRGHGPNKSTGALMRSIGRKIETMGDYYQSTIGTGVGTTGSSKSAEKYAMIQDRGGTTHPTVTPRMKKWAWAMYYKSRKQNDMYKGIALTKKSKLTVRIPATHWFTDVWEYRISLLNQRYLNDRIIWETAQKMSGGIHG